MALCRRRWRLVLALEAQLGAGGLRRDVVTWGAKGAALERAGQWRRAFEAEGGTLGVVQATARLGALERAERWRDALLLFCQLEAAALQINLLVYSALVSICAGQWRQDLQVLRKFRSSQLSMDEVMHGSVLNACRQGLLWQDAHLLAFCGGFAPLSAVAAASAAAAASTACAWRCAAAFLREAVATRTRPNVILQSVALRLW
ncbi:unnamed protein product, partial [Effrenium voratum]